MESQQDIVDLTINDDDDCFFLTEPSKMAANSLKMNGMGGGNKKTAKQNHEDVSVCGSEDGESVYGSEDGEINAKQNQEDDTFSVYGSEDGEITAKQNQEDDTLSVYGSDESVYGSGDGEITAKQNQEDDIFSVYGSEDSEIESKKIIFKRIWPNIGKKPRKAMPQSAAFDVYSCSHKTIYPGKNGKVQFGIQNENAKRILCQNIWKIGNDSQAWHSFGRWHFHNRRKF